MIIQLILHKKIVVFCHLPKYIHFLIIIQTTFLLKLCPISNILIIRILGVFKQMIQMILPSFLYQFSTIFLYNCPTHVVNHHCNHSTSFDMKHYAPISHHQYSTLLVFNLFDRYR